jgi:hypothetical protein
MHHLKATFLSVRFLGCIEAGALNFLFFFFIINTSLQRRARGADRIAIGECNRWLSKYNRGSIDAYCKFVRREKKKKKRKKTLQKNVFDADRSPIISVFCDRRTYAEVDDDRCTVGATDMLL